MKRNANLTSVIAELEKQKLHLNKQQGKTLPVLYSPQLRSFALTLHFYSPHAYKYVRKMFDTCLPHPRTIEKWYSSFDGTPGFIEAVVQEKMNVKLAAQLLSESVARSLQFCREENLPGFEGCEPIMRFICTFNKLFDILNSRTLHSWGFKKPMQASNEAEIFDFLFQAKAYIFSLKESQEGQNMLNCNRKTGLGLLYVSTVCCHCITF